MKNNQKITQFSLLQQPPTGCVPFILPYIFLTFFDFFFLSLVKLADDVSKYS
jgi:hypothetical protein